MVLLLAGLLCIAGCAQPNSTGPQLTTQSISSEADYQQALKLEQKLNDTKTIQTVAFRVLSGNADACGKDVAPTYGFLAFSSEDLRTAERSAARRLWGLDKTPRVAHVVPDSPAFHAGMAEGDLIVGIGGKSPPASGPSETWFRRALAGDSSTRQIVVVREGEQKDLVVRGVSACSYPVLAIDGTDVAAMTDGQRIVIETGTLRVTRTEDQLAAIVAHELAHITMDHIDKKKQNTVAGAAGGLVVDIAFAALGVNTGGQFTKIAANAGAQAFSQDFEKEADYIAMYYLHRAGYDVNQASGVWRGMALENPVSIRFAGTHPTSAERFVLMEATRDEIIRKEAAGLPVQPDGKPAGQLVPAATRDPSV